MALRTGALLTLCVCGTALAQAPQDPYGADPVLNEQIAEQLVGRAQELLDAKLWLDAKQLAVEALVKSPKGTAADHARFIIKTVNTHLDIKEDPAPMPPSGVTPTATPDLTPIDDPTTRTFDPGRAGPSAPPPEVPETPEARGAGDARTAATVHASLFGGVIGATLGAYIYRDTPAAVGVPLGVVTGLGAGFLAYRYADRLHWSEAQIRTAGSLSFWGGAFGGLMGEAITGAGNGTSPTATGVLLGASIGSTAGLLAGAGLAHKDNFTRGDVALVDTLAGMGAVGGLTMGMLMQPAQPEAYAVNSMLGIAGGVAIGLIAAPQTNTTPRRMLRVAAFAAGGGALPFLLYAGIHDPHSSGDERLTGFLSTVGMVAGAYIGFRVTSSLDAGLDTKDGKPAAADAPAAVVGRSSDGTWGFGGLPIAPLPTSVSNAHGLGITLVGGSF